jgi:hypothetical protein
MVGKEEPVVVYDEWEAPSLPFEATFWDDTSARWEVIEVLVREKPLGTFTINKDQPVRKPMPEHDYWVLENRRLKIAHPEIAGKTCIIRPRRAV